MQAVARTDNPPVARLDVGKALELRLKKHLSYEEIGERLGVTKQAVQKRLSKIVGWLDDPEAVAAYDKTRADVLTAVERELIQNLVDPAKLKAASLNNVAYSFQQVNNARRLERGEPTVNQASLSVIANIDGDLDDVRAAISKLRGQSD